MKTLRSFLTPKYVTQADCIDKDKQIAAYLDWAHSKGLKTVSVFEADKDTHIARARFNVREVSRDEYTVKTIKQRILAAN